MDKRPLSKRRMALDNFVGRQDILENLDSWTTEFLDGENRFVMIEGMGGIGKSTLLEKWTEDLQKQNLPVVLVRCDDFKGDIFRKAEFISRKLNEFDIKTHRFETIRVMHHRLINNTDPRDIVDEKNPLWAIASYIPGVSSIQEYATTIKEVSRWIKDYLEKRLKNIDKWFKIWFDCDDYNDELIRVVLEDRTLENSLILGALSADIKDSNENVFIIFDVFESVIEDAAIQRIRGEKIILESVDIVEDDLWTLFLGVKEIFGVISGRELPEYTRLPMFDNDSVRSIKLDELDYDSCSKLLVHLRIPTEIHEDIIAASARNPLVISLLCDAAINKPVTAVEIRKLQGKNIDRVREEALAIMMRHLPSPLRLLARISAITPIFDEPILSQTIAKMPEFGTISVFHNFMQLNMIIPKDVGWSLHDSVRKLLVSDFSQDFLDEWCPRISTVLQNRYDTETNMQFLVAKIEVDSLKNEKEALRNLDDIYNNYLNQIRFGDALDFLSKCYAFFKAHYSLSQINREQSYILSKLRRLDEAENHAKQSIKNALHGLEHSLNLSEDDVENLSQVSEKFSIEFLKDNSDFIYNYVECLKRFGDTLFDSGKFADSEISYKKCLKVLEGLNKIIDVSSERFASIYSELAWICKTELRYKEANDLFSQTIEITRNQVGLDPENNLRLLSTRLNSYSMLLWSVGRYEEAETLLLESLDILQKSVSHESVDDLQSLSHRYRNLADLRRVQGHYEDAEQYYLKSISLRRQLADSYSGYFLSPLCNALQPLATMYRDWGRFKESETYFQEVFEIRSKLYAEFPSVYGYEYSTILNALAVQHKRNEQFVESEECLRKALEIRRNLYELAPSVYAVSFGHTITTLAVLLRNLRRFDESMELYLEANRIFRLCANDNPDGYLSPLAYNLNELAILHRKQNECEKAEDFHLEALEIYNNLADEFPDAYTHNVAFTLNQLGLLYRRLGNDQEAEVYFREALDIYRKLVDKSPEVYMKNVVHTITPLAQLLRNKKQYIECEKLLRDALRINETLTETSPEVYGPDLAYTQANLGNLLRGSHQYDEAEELLDKAYWKYKELAKTQPKIYLHQLASTAKELALLLKTIDCPVDSEKLFLESLEIYRSLYDSSSRYKSALKSTLHSLAYFLKDYGRHQEADDYFQEANCLN